MTLNDVKILVIGDRVWGCGATLEEALRKAEKPRYYFAYLCVAATRVDEMGRICFPKDNPPRVIIRKLPRQKLPRQAKREGNG